MKNPDNNDLDWSTVREQRQMYSLEELQAEDSEYGEAYPDPDYWVEIFDV